MPVLCLYAFSKPFRVKKRKLFVLFLPHFFIIIIIIVVSSIDINQKHRVCECAGNEPNMIRIQEPVIIIGDIHGQFYDMIHMFEKVVDPKGIPG